MIDTVIYLLLKNVSEVQAHIDDRIYPSVVPERCKYSAIRYLVNDKPDEITAAGPDGNEQASLQIDIYHSKYSSCRLVAKAIKKVLHGYQGSHANIEVDLIEFLDSYPLYESKSREHRTLMTFNIQYRES